MAIFSGQLNDDTSLAIGTHYFELPNFSDAKIGSVHPEYGTVVRATFRVDISDNPDVAFDAADAAKWTDSGVSFTAAGGTAGGQCEPIDNIGVARCRFVVIVTVAGPVPINAHLQ